MITDTSTVPTSLVVIVTSIPQLLQLLLLLLLLLLLVPSFPTSVVAGGTTTIRSALYKHIQNRPNVAQILSRPTHRDPLGLMHLDYGNHHPFRRQQRRRRRHLQYNETDLEYDYHDYDTARDDDEATPNNNNNIDDYSILRVRFIVEPLLSKKGREFDTAIDYIVHEILPAVYETWARHLSVFPVQGSIPISDHDCFGGFLQDDLIPQSILQNGVADADLVILVHGDDSMTFSDGTMVNFCSGNNNLAVATACTLDQYDRPVIGFINFCLGNLEEEGSPVTPFLVAIHEVGHVLGISDNLIKYYRTPNGTPRTPRPLQTSIAECVDGSFAEMVLPDESYLVLGKTPHGLLHYTLTTPRALQAARNHFNCQSVTGLRLENHPTEVLGDCIGTHLDERLYFTELMSSQILPNSQTALSALTLAWLEDSGWYRVYYGGVKNSPYGLGAGCAFVEEDCIQDNIVPSFGLGDFCNGLTRFDDSGSIDGQLTDMFCDPSHVSWAYCDLFDTSNLPANFSVTFPVNSTRYFPDFPNVSASTPQSDWCPMPIIPVGIDCTDDSLRYSFPGTYDGEQYGPGNRCINAEFNLTSSYAKLRPACLSVECNANTTTVTVGGQLCEYDGQRHSIALSASYYSENDGTGTFICPKVTTMCPHFFCEGGCSARGVCNYDAQPPKCECDDPNDTSEQCSGAFGTRAPFTVAPSPVPQPPSDDRRPVPAKTSSGTRGVAGWTRSLRTVVLLTWVVSGYFHYS